ncbi:MAG: polysaccharide biosynthesis/export family protein, partial [Mucinivorans sp.]
MRKLIVAILLLTSTLSMAQTPAQMQQLKNLTPAQINALKQSQGVNHMKSDKEKKDQTVLPLGDRTPKERQFTNYDSTRFGFGKDPIPTKYEKLLRLDTDSLTVDKQEYVDLRMKADKENTKANVFGREIFNSKNLTFAPSMSIATPTNYILSAGDEVIVNLWGAAEATYNLTVSPEGNINIPNVGLINVAGITVGQAEGQIKNKLVSSVAGLSDGTVHIKITLGDIRSIKVNIVGEALTPGTYTL